MTTRDEEIKHLLAKQEHEIDTSDVPELEEGFWKEAVRGQFYKPKKVQKTVRIDADILQWLEHCGPGYQTRLNKILREAMLKDIVQNGQ